MSIKGFNVNGVTEQYDYNSLDNKPEIHNVPTGGTAGQVLAKTSGADYAVGWVNQTGGGGGGDIIVDSALSTTSENPVQNKVVTTAINAKYAKPAYGIPATDMTSAVQASLAKADTALQTAPVTSVNGQTGDVTVQAATDTQVTTAVNTWLSENVAQETGYVLDSTLTMSNAAAPADKVGDLKSAFSDVVNLGDGSYTGTWTQGSLNRGAEMASIYRIRTDYIFVPKGSALNISVQSGFSYEIDYYNAQKVYQSDEGWLTTPKLVSPASDIYVRILLRYAANNVEITPDKYTNISIKLIYPLVNAITKTTTALDGTRTLPTEMGGIIGGKPNTSANYFRTKDFVWANKGDTLTLAPNGINVTYACVYMYTTDDESGYYSDVDLPTTAAGSSNSYTFPSDCYFKARGNIGRATTPADLYLLDTFYTINQLYNLEEAHAKNGFAVDVDSINNSISGKFNIALQTDTHMSAFVGYSTTAYAESDFDKLSKTVNTVNRLSVDLFANLGDFIRGYGFDPDFQTRASIDKMMEQYRRIATNKAFVIGNHDDGCMYYRAEYNDKPSTANVLYPNEQFNRFTKFGLNNMGANNYYYADVNGVRVIALYQRDFDYTETVPQIEQFKIGDDQLSWLRNTALNTSLPIIILTHAPLESSLYATSRTGFDDALAAIKAFKTNGGTVIAILSGHTHEQGSAVVDGIPNIVFANGYTWFELVSVDLSNRSITCKAINSTLAEMTFSY